MHTLYIRDGVLWWRNHEGAEIMVAVRRDAPWWVKLICWWRNL